VKSIDSDGRVARALNWVAQNELPGGGIRAYSRSQLAYPEVTGYLIPTLLRYRANAIACRLAEWLIRVQIPDGSFAGLDGSPYVFDTAQALRGLVAVSRVFPRSLGAARQAAEYLCSQALERGKEGFGRRYHGRIPESIHLYALPPLREAARLFGKPEYDQIANNCVQYYSVLPDAFQPESLTHYLCYALEAAIDLGRADLANPALSALRAAQQDGGSVRGRAGVSWICTPGLAQLAVCWYKTGAQESANRAMCWLDSHQRRSGGFRGSHGLSATYFAREELSWAVKFYLDACTLRRRNAGILTTSYLRPAELSLGNLA